MSRVDSHVEECVKVSGDKKRKRLVLVCVVCLEDSSSFISDCLLMYVNFSLRMVISKEALLPFLSLTQIDRLAF